MPDDGLVPVGLRLTPDPGTQLVTGAAGQDNVVLVGGSPVRVLRLTAAGARQVAGWLAGSPVPASAGARSLARRLLDAGIAHPDFSPPAVVGPAGDGPPAAAWPRPADVTVVIPVRDRQAELDRCLAGLSDLPHVIVVDDA